MTPEEHIERAEWILELPNASKSGIKKAAIHVAIADHKKRFPPDSGRPRPSYPTGYGDGRRPITDNPQA